MIATPVIIVGSCAGGTVLVASYALYKWYKTKQQLDTFTRKYDSDVEVQKCLMHQFCDLESVPLLQKIIPADCDHFHERLTDLCFEMCDKHNVPLLRLLDVGAGTAGLSCRLASRFRQVVATDTSYSMNVAGQQLLQFREYVSPFPAEGAACGSFFQAKLPARSHTEVTVWDEDVCSLVYTCGKFDCIVVVNTLTELSNPVDFLASLEDYSNAGCLLVIVDCYDWPQNSHIVEVDGAKSIDKIGTLLGERWVSLETRDVPFYCAQTERSAQVGMSEASFWKRLPNI